MIKKIKEQKNLKYHVSTIGFRAVSIFFPLLWKQLPSHNYPVYFHIPDSFTVT